MNPYPMHIKYIVQCTHTFSATRERLLACLRSLANLMIALMVSARVCDLRVSRFRQRRGLISYPCVFRAFAHAPMSEDRAAHPIAKREYLYICAYLWTRTVARARSYFINITIECGRTKRALGNPVLCASRVPAGAICARECAPNCGAVVLWRPHRNRIRSLPMKRRQFR